MQLILWPNSNIAFLLDHPVYECNFLSIQLFWDTASSVKYLRFYSHLWFGYTSRTHIFMNMLDFIKELPPTGTVIFSMMLLVKTHRDIMRFLSKFQIALCMSFENI